jgi:hypothetical protein
MKKARSGAPVARTDGVRSDAGARSTLFAIPHVLLDAVFSFVGIADMGAVAQCGRLCSEECRRFVDALHDLDVSDGRADDGWLVSVRRCRRLKRVALGEGTRLGGKAVRTADEESDGDDSESESDEDDDRKFLAATRRRAAVVDLIHRNSASLTTVSLSRRWRSPLTKLALAVCPLLLGTLVV